jgi:hypothetical protein
VKLQACVGYRCRPKSVQYQKGAPFCRLPWN